MNPDKAATYVGSIVAVVNGLGIDFHKLGQGDMGEISRAVVTLGIIAFGVFTKFKWGARDAEK